MFLSVLEPITMERTVRQASERSVKKLAYVKSLCSDEGLTLETSGFQNSLRRLIYPYQLHVDN